MKDNHPNHRIRAFVCVVLVCFALPSSQAQENALTGVLLWKNGDRIPGYAVSADSAQLQWQTKIFRDPLGLDLAYLDQIQFQSSPKLGKTTETYAVQTIDGYSLFGEVTKVDDQVLSMSSKRFGEIAIDRDQVATVLNLKTSGSIVHGVFDLSKWDANRNEKRFWEVNNQGQLKSLRKNVHLFMKTDLPESALIDIELEWEKKLDFVFGFGVPRNSRKIESLPRLESWDDSVVLSFGNDFEIVIESIEEESKRLKLLIHWNRKTDELVIHDKHGKQLATAELGKPSIDVDPGIYIENKSGDLRINSLMVIRSSKGFNATKPSIQSLERPAINGEIHSFDGNDWVISTSDAEDQETSNVTVSADHFCGAFLVNPGKDRPEGGARLKFRDGMHVGGELVSIQNHSFTVKSEFASQPITLRSDGAAQLRFGTPQGNVSGDEVFAHRLFNRAGEIQGRLEKGTGTTSDILRWRVTGADAAVPLAQGDARIVLQKPQPISAVPNQWAHTLYMSNRDMIPCRVVSIDQQHVTIESFTENKQIDQRLVKAIDFRNIPIGESIGMENNEWVIPKSSKTRVNVADSKMELSKGAEVGHPWLCASGGFEFDVAWKKNGFGVLECRTLISDVAANQGGKQVNIMLYGDNLFIADPGQSNPTKGVISVSNNRARIAFKFRDGKLTVNVDGKRAYTERIAPSTQRGGGVQFQLNDLHRRNIKCAISNFKLTYSNSGNSVLVDPTRKQLLLTIPRHKKRNPPKQILCATNGDLVRGELVSMDGEFVMFRSGGEVMRFQRNVINSIVWLHAKGLAGEVVGATVDADQTAQVLMQGSRRMTFSLDSWTDDCLAGNSDALGRCQIPMDQIYELRFGSFAGEASDVPYSDWVAVLAPEPKMESGASGDSESAFLFGSGSPLIGTVAKPFTASMMDGGKFSLKSNLGKVVVLDFWATWCGPCIQAFPKLDRAIAQFTTDQVTFLAVNQEEEADQIKRFLESRELDFPVALDSGKIGQQFDVRSLPQTVVIDRDGKVAFVNVGNSNELETKLKAAIDQLLTDDHEAP